MLGWLAGCEVWADRRAADRERPRTRSARTTFLMCAPTGTRQQAPSQIRLRPTATRCTEGKDLGPGKTSQLRILASILAQRLFGGHMFNRYKDKSLERSQGSRAGIILALALVLVMVGVSQSAGAQDPKNQAPATQSPSAPSPAQDNGKPKQDVPDEAGGPTDSVGPYAIPKKKAEA